MQDDQDAGDTSVANARLKHIFSRRSTDELRQSYSAWADEYDKDLVEDLGYRAPELVADAATRFLGQTTAPMLDIGCGTGLTGEALLESGDWILHGLDLSREMLDQARQKDIYDELILANLNEPLSIADDTYGGAISSGTFTHGHVKADALCEITRVLKPGAPFAFTVHSEFWEVSGFSETLDKLSRQRQLELVEKEERPHISTLPDKTSFICVAVAT